MKLQVSVFATSCALIAWAESDETLLLQTHATRKNDPAEQALSESVTESHKIKKDTKNDFLKNMNVSNPAEMSLLVADYAASAVKDGVRLDDATKAALTAMKQSLESESQVYMTNAHTTDQDLLTAQAAAVNGCDSTYTQSGSEDAELLATVTSRGAAHTTCRGEQDGLLVDRTTKCDALTTFIAGVSACPSVPGRDGMGAFFSSVGGIWAQQQTWQTRENECKAAEDDFTAKDGECDTTQEEYETNFCTLRVQMHETCAAYTTCYTQAIGALGETTSSVEQNEGARKIEWTAIEKIKCYIDVLISDSENEDRQTALGACKDLEPVTSHLDITYPTVSDEQTCDLAPVAAPPCSPEFEAGYAAFNADFLRTCVPCAELPAHLQHPGGVSELQNLALGRPTSMGPGMWSSFESKYCADGSTRDDQPPLTPCTYDANGETTQSGSCQSVCHTGSGPNAWWEVGLAEPSLVESVQVVNAWAHCCKDRIIPFHIYLLDGAGGTIASKQFTQVQDEFVWEAANTANVQKVKVMLDGSNYLHMAEVFVMGRTAVAAPPAPAPPVIPPLPADGTCPPFNADIIEAADWKFGGTTGNGHTCNDVCAQFGKVCNEQSETLQTLICSTEAFTALWQHAHPNAAGNPSCNMAHSNCRSYAGTPFAQYGANCYYFCPHDIPGGTRSVCNGNNYGHHDVLCACQEAA